MDATAPLMIVAALIFGRTTFALLDGSASNHGGYRRQDTPGVFWFTIAFGYVATLGVLGYAFWSRFGA